MCMNTISFSHSNNALLQVALSKKGAHNQCNLIAASKKVTLIDYVLENLSIALQLNYSAIDKFLINSIDNANKA